MMFIPRAKVKYHCDISDLLVSVLSVHHVNQEKGYIKLKYILTNKRNGIFYEQKTAKLELKNIQHWKQWIQNT